jgi:hypothetical protein
MFPRQSEDVATAHVRALRKERISRRYRPAGRTGTRTIRSQAGWTLVAMGLRLASPVNR